MLKQLKYRYVLFLRVITEYLVTTNSSNEKKVKFVVLITGISLFSIFLLPFTVRMNLLPIGFDFANLFWFHNCPGYANSPYLVEGKLCGDQLNRAMIYPPTMYWTYVWTRGLSFTVAYAVWFSAIVGAVFFSIRALPYSGRKYLFYFIFICLLLQFPTLFALERGNNDAVILVVWSFIIILWNQDRIFWSGFMAGLTVMLKLYTGIPLFVLLLAFLVILTSERSWKIFYKTKWFIFGYGIMVCIGLMFFLAWEQNYDYFFKVLPKWMNEVNWRDVTNHSIQGNGHESKVVAITLGLILVVSWFKIAVKMMRTDPVLVFCGLLAISTYFPNISNDYNLITTYPLIALCWFRSFEGKSKDLYFILFATAFLGPIGIKWLWKFSRFDKNGVHVLYQVVWLANFWRLSKSSGDPSNASFLAEKPRDNK